jgi:hypothetical protein
MYKVLFLMGLKNKNKNKKVYEPHQNFVKMMQDTLEQLSYTSGSMRRETGRNRTSMRLETVETVHVLGGDL